MIINLCYLEYQHDKSKYLFKNEKFLLDFQETRPEDPNRIYAKEIVSGQPEREIRMTTDDHIRTRPEDSNRI